MAVICAFRPTALAAVYALLASSKPPRPTGGIIALGLADGKSGSDMLRFYREEGAGCRLGRDSQRSWG